MEGTGWRSAALAAVLAAVIVTAAGFATNSRFLVGCLAAAMAGGAVACALCRRRGAEADAVPPAALAASRQRDGVAHTVHELRTPLSAVLTALDLLRDDVVLDEDDRRLFVHQATIAARHMAFLINDLLDSAALSANKLSLHLRENHVRDITVDVAQVMGLMAQNRDIRLELVVPPEDLVVQCDRARVLQVLFNLIGNALKFSKRGTTVMLLVTPAQPWCQFEVVDEGAGVPDAVRENLFHRFAQSDANAQTNAPSTGLGLYLCRQLVELMNGTISYRPRVDGGSVFAFLLPLAGHRGPDAATADALDADAAAAAPPATA